MNITNYLEDKLSKHCAGLTAFAMPAAFEIHLHTADPTETGAVAEVANAPYAPKPVTFAAAANGVTQNAALIRWDDIGATTVTHFSISDGTNRLFYAALSASVVVGAGQPLEIPANAIVVTFD
jgi:hypothetical protein